MIRTCERMLSDQSGKDEMLDLESVARRGDDLLSGRHFFAERRYGLGSPRTKAFMSWWLVVLAIGAAVFYAFLTGAAQHVFLGDVTRITWATAALAVVVTVILGHAAYGLVTLSKNRRFSTVAQRG
jgi:hypothetical protein